MMTGNTINNYRKLKKKHKQSCSHEKELDQILNYLSSLPSLIRLVPYAIASPTIMYRRTQVTGLTARALNSNCLTQSFCINFVTRRGLHLSCCFCAMLIYS